MPSLRLNSWLRGRTAALRGAHSLAYLHDRLRSLRSGRLAFHSARSALQPHPSECGLLRGRTASRGFTLIELLAAISILAFVAVLSWRGLDTIIRTRITLTSTLEQTRGMQLAFAQMQSDCEHIVKSEEIGNRAVLLAEPGRLTMVRTAFADNQPSRLLVVTYRLRDGVLSRTESDGTRDLRQLNELWLAAVSDGVGRSAVALQSGVEAMDLRLWSRSAGWYAAGAAPLSTPAPPQGQASASAATAPTGIEVTLRLGASPNGMVKVMLLGAV